MEVETPLGRLLMQGVVPRLSETPGGIAWAGPSLGVHTREILEEVLGLGEEAWAELVAERVVAWAERA